jgi:pilus assembly protein CpaE
MAGSLKAFLVGCDEGTIAAIRAELLHRRTTVEAQFPNVRSALDGIRLTQNERCLCFVRVADEEAVQQLKWLSHAMVGRPLIALVDADADARLILAANRAGAGQVLTLPLEDRDLASALESFAVRYAAPEPVSSRRVIAVCGATGGCGTTTLAINMAYEVATALKLTCTLAELTTKMGAVAPCLNLAPRYTTLDLFQQHADLDPQAVADVLTPVTDRFSALVAPWRDAETVPVRAHDVPPLVRALKQRADTVVLDVPCHFEDVHWEALGLADQIILVAEQSVPSLSALNVIREKLEHHDIVKPPLVIINRFDGNKAGFSLDHLQRLLHTPQILTIANDYPGVSGAINAGRPLRLHAPRSRVLKDLSQLVRYLFERQPLTQPQAPKSSFFGRLIRALGNGDEAK